MTDTGETDKHGIPIFVGDLLRIPHYKHRRGKRNMFLHLWVGVKNGKYVLMRWSKSINEEHQCLLSGLATTRTCEVVEETGLYRKANGEIMTFNERPRR